MEALIEGHFHAMEDFHGPAIAVPLPFPARNLEMVAKDAQGLFPMDPVIAEVDLSRWAVQVRFHFTTPFPGQDLQPHLLDYCIGIVHVLQLLALEDPSRETIIPKPRDCKILQWCTKLDLPMASHG